MPIASAVTVSLAEPDAQDTGGAIVGQRIDVYRSPPASASDGGQYLVNQPVFVIKAAG